MTPAINLAKKNKISYTVHSYEHDPAADSYGGEAAEALDLPASRVFKTLLVSPPGKPKELSVAIVPVAGQLDMKSMANAIKTKKLEMANPDIAQSTTGYLVGGISPLGQKKRLPTIIDSSAQEFETVFVSAGRRGLEIELAPEDLRSLTNATFSAIAKL